MIHEIWFINGDRTEIEKLTFRASFALGVSFVGFIFYLRETQGHLISKGISHF